MQEPAPRPVLSLVEGLVLSVFEGAVAFTENPQAGSLWVASDEVIPRNRTLIPPAARDALRSGLDRQLAMPLRARTVQGKWGRHLQQPQRPWITALCMIDRILEFTLVLECKSPLAPLCQRGGELAAAVPGIR